MFEITGALCLGFFFYGEFAGRELIDRIRMDSCNIAFQSLIFCLTCS